MITRTRSRHPGVAPTRTWEAILGAPEAVEDILRAALHHAA